MKIVFIVQGEGRGHLTQAVSLFQQLEGSSHHVVACFIGRIEKDAFTSEVEKGILTPIHYFNSPNLIYNQKSQGLSLRSTLIHNIKHLPKHAKSLCDLKKSMDFYRPDLIINFYDFLAGIYQLRFPFSAPPMVCIGHQYLLLHPQFEFPKKKYIDRLLVNLNSKVTAIRAKKLWALSFSQFQVTKRMICLPPLIRKTALEEPKGLQPYFVAYLTNSNLLEQLANWHIKNMDIELHCFTKNSQGQEVTQLHKNLFIHKLDNKKFLKLMANAKGLVTTAGFESVCEAIYFGKPVMMVPVKNHFEQACNALDAERYGAGIAQESFDLDMFMSYVKSFQSKSQKFTKWLAEGKSLMLHELDGLEKTLKST
ncbi:MAG: hypothetical protein ACI9DJ_001446 [Algoriphagus sp.]|jgi:uncharacterized protein (TIGR00661 family)